MISGGIWGLFGGGLDLSLEFHFKSLAFSLDLPLFLPTSSLFQEEAAQASDFGFPIKLAPSKSLLAMALRDAVLFLNWTRAALLYEEPQGGDPITILLRKSLKFPLPGLAQLEYLIKKVEPSQKGGLSSKRSELFAQEVSPANYREVLNEIKRRNIFNIIVDIKHLPLFFRIVSSCYSLIAEK